MKIILIRLIIITTVFSFLFSCKTEKKADVPNAVIYDSVLVANVYHLDNDSTKPSCSLKVKYLYPAKYTDTQILQKIQGELNFAFMEDEKYEKLLPVDAVNQYVKDYIENYKNDAKEQFPNWQESGDSEDYFSYYKSLDSKVVFDMSNIISYQISSMDYKGGANSSTAFRNVVIDLKSGDILSEKDIFTGDYRGALNALLIRKVVEQNKVQKPEDLIEFGYWGIEDLASNNNFLVDTKGITYIFNPGEYSAPTLGEIRISLSYEELMLILKKDSPISIFF
ncbi:DUF3298 and DUF4163 domain-containing protein [Dysgonomonas sp. BGC7]|uniref:DUF3298 and DUF4163 domain-containing protein n=1 Tax=Dysgonomonas sp. BGC7 TaxID=1658008 RepID=UPI0006816F66|nr:DUF3298 and DUF4163 domain-containing protein [Dysgonomonas sp. BGC7]MBD8389591.1 DUF4163 domain-containing protein [Dysgonomonas sp. BGC7]